MMEKKVIPSNKLNILFLFLIIILTVSIVPKTFQNDTFFNISIGKYIIENGIDMKDHFCWITDLDYTYSHWAFDVIIYLIYSKFSFLGIYLFTILFAILINVTLFIILNKLYNSPSISFCLTLCTAFLNKTFYTSRSQIISFLCFIIEIYCIEKYIETDSKKYAFSIFIIGIIVANFHAASWPLVLVLFLPYIVASFFNFNTKKNLKTKLDNNFKSESNSKIFTRQNYNTKHLLILMIFITITGFITPLHDVPFSYTFKSMFGHSNFGILKSIYYVNEMQPIIPANSIPFLIFTVILIEFLLVLPTKLKLEHSFLILGLFVMTITSTRYLALLLFLGSYVIADLITQSFNLYAKNSLKTTTHLLSLKPLVILILVTFCIYTFSEILNKNNTEYVNPELFPTKATNYILENIDYKNMRIFNNYNFGSYLIFNNIPVFIDSRLDVYCSEFNNTDIFYDFINVITFNEYYEKVFSKYNFTHKKKKNDERIINYLEQDTNYNKIYEDSYFTLFERNLTQKNNN